MKKHRELLILILFTLLILFLFIVLTQWNSGVRKIDVLENKIDSMQTSRNNFKDSINRIIEHDSICILYRDTLTRLRYDKAELEHQVYIEENNSENAWNLYYNLERITDSIAKTKIRFVNISPILKNKLQYNPKMVSLDPSLTEIKVVITKDEYELLNRIK